MPDPRIPDPRIPDPRIPDAADPPGLRMTALRAWLDRADVGLDCGSPLVATLFPSGRSNVTYLLTDGHGAAAVLRRPPLGNVMPTAHDMAREHRVLTGLARADFPAPAPLALCQDPDVIGAPFLVMGYVPGRIVATADDSAALDAVQRSDISASLVSTLALLHGVDVGLAGLSDLGRPEGFLERQSERWSKQWALTKTRELPSMDLLHERLRPLLSSVPDGLPGGLVHGDYRLDNVIVSIADEPARTQVRAVLDWEMSTLGDPLSDLGLMLVYWTQAGDRLRREVPVAVGITDAPGFLDRAGIIEAYARATGHPLDHLDAATALACYKLAVITESIHARTLSGKQLGTAATDAGAMGTATTALAELGQRVLDEGAVAGLAA